MADHTLRGCLILVVEDEFLLAQDICDALVEKQASVLGPAATVEQGLALLQQTEQLSGAILDINLRGEHVFALADQLVSRDIPFVFATGYDGSAVPPRFGNVTRCEKPVRISKVVEALGRVAPV